MVTSINDTEIKTLNALWKESGLSPVIAEYDTRIESFDGKHSSFLNFCPEVSYTHFQYYADSLSKYADDIDRDSECEIAERENIPNDWRYEWELVSACHFLDCNVYNQVQNFNSKGIGKFDKLAHSNIVTLIGRMEQCLENSDPSGVLHAAASILETTAKDIINNDHIENQTLGGFIKQFKKESALPNGIKDVVGKIYELRNTMPLSAHGSTNTPTITMQDAIIIAATTKFVVEIEYRIRKN